MVAQAHNGIIITGIAGQMVAADTLDRDDGAMPPGRNAGGQCRGIVVQDDSIRMDK